MGPRLEYQASRARGRDVRDGERLQQGTCIVVEFERRRTHYGGHTGDDLLEV